tara:strand:+ start:399 stop:1427 length:1029 start_codon:yes stop_codon:yes gene_type:complete
MTKKQTIQTALIVGVGSIGLRHLNLIKEIDPDIKLIALRHKESKGPNPENVDHVVTSVKDALIYDPNIAIISNPSPLHLDVAMPLAEAGVHLLIEKPISSSTQRVGELISLAKKNNCKLMVGYNLRFLNSLIFFRKKVLNQSIGKIFSIRSEAGQHLESWRPNTKYTDGVSAQRRLGGGVLLELSHEFDYLSWIFGRIDWVAGHLSKQSDLDIDVEDTAHCLLGFKDEDTSFDLIANVSLDFIRSDPVRQCSAIGELGSLRWDGIKNTVEIYSKDQKRWQVLYEDVEDKNFSYKKELNHFIECVVNDSSPLISGESAMDTLRVIEGIRKSSSKGIAFQVDYE